MLLPAVLKMPKKTVVISDNLTKKKKSNTLAPVSHKVKQIITDNNNLLPTLEKTNIKGLYMGHTNQIPVFSYNTDSDKDMCKRGMFGNSTICEILDKSEFEVDKHGNITYIENPIFEEPIIEISNVVEHTRTRVIKKPLTDEETEICEINYGYARKFFIHKSYDGTNIDEVLRYEGRNRVTPEQTYYEGILICAKGSEDKAKNFIQEILKTDKNKRASVIWL